MSFCPPFNFDQILTFIVNNAIVFVMFVVPNLVNLIYLICLFVYYCFYLMRATNFTTFEFGFHLLFRLTILEFNRPNYFE